MRKIEYVASGMSHTRILNIAATESKEILEIINGYFTSVNGKNNHNFSLLYNAFTEKDFGKKFFQFYKPSLFSVHADSGGLQIVTQGKSITPELKDLIYKTQAESSDIAMCFDEIPIGMVGERSNRNDTTGRFFDKENLEEYARKTGKNIKRQIEVFQESNSNAKPMLIAQGNDYETYMYWTEYLLKEIPPSYYPFIGGIAMGAAALGTGILEDMERAVYCTALPFQMDEPYIHILGVGSIRRLLPYIALTRSGYFPNNLHLSYDSTTHTSGLSVGLYYYDDATISLKRHYTNDYEKIFWDVNEKYNLVSKGINEADFHKMVNSNSTYYGTDTDVIDTERMASYYNVITGFICSSILNFTKSISDCLNSRKKLMLQAQKSKVTLEIGSLLETKTVEDFLKWKAAHSFSSRSNRISADKPVSLEGFF